MPDCYLNGIDGNQGEDNRFIAPSKRHTDQNLTLLLPSENQSANPCRFFEDQIESPTLRLHQEVPCLIKTLTSDPLDAEDDLLASTLGRRAKRRKA